MIPEDLLLLFNKRQSVRSYSDRPVEFEKLMRCVEAARIAPSASNAQPWKFIVVNDPDLKNKIGELATGELVSINRFAKQAPVIIVVVREKANMMSYIGQTLKNREFPLIDIGISVIQFCLQAVAEGLGTCILGWFQEKKIKRLLNVPFDKRIELLITVGYASGNEIRQKIRKETNKMLSFNKY